LWCCFHSALGGDLHRHCIAYDSDEPASSRSEREVVFLLRQILEGVKHMHDQDYVHLDIKVRSLRCWYYVWVVLASQCLFGLNFREGVVTRGDFSKHSTVNFFVTDKFNQFTQGDPCLLSRSCVISYFQLRLRFCIFSMHVQLFSKMKHLYIEIRVLPLLEQCMWSVAYCSSENHSSRFNILRLQIAAFHFTDISKLIIKWTRQSSTFNGNLVNERLPK